MTNDSVYCITSQLMIYNSNELCQDTDKNKHFYSEINKLVDKIKYM